MTERNASGVKRARTTTGELVRSAEALAGIVHGLAQATGRANGRARTNGH